MNTLIVIGYTSDKKCYLNIDESEAIIRYCDSEGISGYEFQENDDITINKYNFSDEFNAYDVWV